MKNRVNGLFDKISYGIVLLFLCLRFHKSSMNMVDFVYQGFTVNHYDCENFYTDGW